MSNTQLTYNINCKETCYTNHNTTFSITVTPNTEEAYQSLTDNKTLNTITYTLTIDNNETITYTYDGAGGTLSCDDTLILTDVYQYPSLHGEDAHDLTHLHTGNLFRIPYTFTNSGEHTLHLNVQWSLDQDNPIQVANVSKTITSIEADSNPAPVIDGHAYLLVEDELNPGIYTITGTYETNNHYIMDLDTAQLEVLKKTTNVTLTSNVSTVQTGDNITLTIHVENTLHEAVTSGVYTIYEDNVVLTTGNLTGTNTQVTITPTTTNNTYHTYKVVYTGTSIYNGSTSTDLIINVTKITPIVTIDSGLLFYPDYTTTVTGTVTLPDNGGPLTSGKCMAKLNGKSVKDGGGSVIYSNLDSNGRFSIPVNLTYNVKGTPTLVITYLPADGYNRTEGSQNITVNYVTEIPVIDFNLAPLYEPVNSGNYTIQATIHLSNPAIDLANTTCKIRVDGEYITRPNSSLTTFVVSSSPTLNQLSTPLPISVGYGESHTITIEVIARTLNYYNIQATSSTATISLEGLETRMPHVSGVTHDPLMMEVNEENNEVTTAIVASGEFTPTIDNDTLTLDILIEGNSESDLTNGLIDYGMNMVIYNKTQNQYISNNMMGMGFPLELVNLCGMNSESIFCSFDDFSLMARFDMENNTYTFIFEAVNITDNQTPSLWSCDPNTGEPIDEIIIILEQYDENNNENYFFEIFNTSTVISSNVLPVLETPYILGEFEPIVQNDSDNPSERLLMWDTVSLHEDSPEVVKANGSPCDIFDLSLSDTYPLTDFDKDYDIIITSFLTDEAFSFQGNSDMIESLDVEEVTLVSDNGTDPVVDFDLVIDTVEGTIDSRCVMTHWSSDTFISDQNIYELILYNLDDTELEDAIFIDLIPEGLQ